LIDIPRNKDNKFYNNLLKIIIKKQNTKILWSYLGDVGEPNGEVGGEAAPAVAVAVVAAAAARAVLDPKVALMEAFLIALAFFSSASFAAFSSATFWSFFNFEI
jgi:hypothetical protein